MFPTAAQFNSIRRCTIQNPAGSRPAACRLSLCNIIHVIVVVVLVSFLDVIACTHLCLCLCQSRARNGDCESRALASKQANACQVNVLACPSEGVMCCWGQGIRIEKLTMRIAIVKDVTRYPISWVTKLETMTHVRKYRSVTKAWAQYKLLQDPMSLLLESYSLRSGSARIMTTPNKIWHQRHDNGIAECTHRDGQETWVTNWGLLAAVLEAAVPRSSRGPSAANLKSRDHVQTLQKCWV